MHKAQPRKVVLFFVLKQNIIKKDEQQYTVEPNPDTGR